MSDSHRGDWIVCAALWGLRPESLWVDVSRHRDRSAQIAAARACEIAESQRISILATGDVRCALPRGRTLLDALTCLHKKTTLDEAGRSLLVNGERHLQRPEAVVERFRDHPEWITATRTVAERCAFRLEDLEYRFPEYPVPKGESQNGYLHALTFRGRASDMEAPCPPAYASNWNMNSRSSSGLI